MQVLIVHYISLLLLGVTYIKVADNITVNRMKKGIYKQLGIVCILSLIISVNNLSSKFLIVENILAIGIVVYINLKKVSYSIFISLLATGIISISDAFIGLFTRLFLPQTFRPLKIGNTSYLLISLIIFSLAYGISFAIKKVFANGYKNIDEFKKNIKFRLPIIAFLALMIINMNVNIIVYRELVGSLNNKLVIINALVNIGTFIVFIIVLNTENKNARIVMEQEHKDTEFNQLLEYIEDVEIMSSDLRKFKHDYVNIIESMRNYIEAGDMEKLKKFYNEELLSESENIIHKDISISLIKNIKINSLKGLIYSKIIKAKSQGIDVKIEIVDEIDEIAMREIDICRIIGILLDNAMEATNLTREKYIVLAIIKEGEYISFIVNNSCVDDVPPIYMLTESGFSTKGEGRGYGLAIINEIINTKYRDAITNITSENNIFTYELTLKYTK